MSKFSSSHIDELRFLSENVGVIASEHQVIQLLNLNELLLKWTKRFNLVSSNTLSDSIIRHLVDSLSVAPYLDSSLNTELDKQSCSDVRHKKIYDVLDVGSGAGFPVLPLAITHPNLSFASVETNGKKTRFQSQVVLELGLENVVVMNERIESVSLSAMNVTSRAFTAPAKFLDICVDKCIPGGRAVLMLGEAARMPETVPAPWENHIVERLDVPGEVATRHVGVCIRGTLQG